MGFFSQDCNSCGHPALCEEATNEINSWMSQVVSISRNGSLHIGRYDGYGRVGGADEALGWDQSVWHRACWARAGKPESWQGASRRSDDQGWFFDDGTHDMAEPGPAGDPVTPAGGTAPWQA